MNSKIHLLGAGILTECVIDLLINEHDYADISIYDDVKDSIQIGDRIFKVSGTIDYGKKMIIEHNHDYFIALGINNRELSLNIMNELLLEGKKPINIISKFAYVSKSATWGLNCLVFPGVMIGCKVEIGNMLICYSNASIEHHIKIGNATVICPRVSIASNVIINDFCFLGIGSTISNNVAIGANSIIGAGALIINSVESSSLAYGLPAKSRLINKIIL